MTSPSGYFASVPHDRESIVALVKREAEEECRDWQLSPLVLDACVREAVETLQGGRLPTFVPLLALRRVRACIRAGTCDCDDW
jgi:hypothetical protein